MTFRLALALSLLLFGLPSLARSGAPAPELRLNQLQFVGSHNSYKQAQSWGWAMVLRWLNEDAARALDYEHLPLAEQLNLGLRVLELDVFYDAASGTFPVGHVQLMDMNSHCSPLHECLAQLQAWSNAHPDHLPLLIMFNAKDQPIPRLPTPTPFDEAAFEALDGVLEAGLGDRLLRPGAVGPGAWPTVAESRGQVLLLLDEGAPKRDLYDTGAPRPLFMHLPESDPRAAIFVINDPLAEGERIRHLVAQGYLVRTRADADTEEARRNDTRRRDAAFASGAQAISTDYYVPSTRFDSEYVVRLPSVARCNPVSAPGPCALEAFSDPVALVDAAEVAPGLRAHLRYAGRENFLGRPVTGYEAPRCLLTVQAAEALGKAQALAEGEGLGLLVYDCYRPQRAVDDFVAWVGSSEPEPTKATYYPEVDRHTLIEQGYIADRSGHSRASTVDLTLVHGATGEPLEMGTPWDFFDERSHTDNPSISPVAKANRQLLKGFMEAAGFRPYYAEWWHFTLDDEPLPNTYLDEVVR
jgi:D-alanyl-D-alanine dipeptidase